jgi:predicted DNA-binding WGR domain protein
MKRRFEFVDGKSNKFWEIWVEGNELATRWGRIGANGQTKSKTLATPEKALGERDKLVAEKLAKGYHEKPQPGLPAVHRGEPHADSPAPDPVEQLSSAATEAVPDETRDPVASLVPEISEPQETDAMVWAFAREYQNSGKWYGRAEPDSVPSGAALMRLDRFRLVKVLKACFRLENPIGEEVGYGSVEHLRERLLRRDLSYSDEDIEFLAAELEKGATYVGGRGIDKPILRAIERHATRHGALSDTARELLRRARDGVVENYFAGNQAALKARIGALVGDDDRIAIRPHEPWADVAIADIEALPAGQRAAWVRLLRHCVKATAAKPTAAWLSAAQPLIETVTREHLLACVNRWFALFDKPRPVPAHEGYMGTASLAVAQQSNEDILRGLVWCCSPRDDCQIARAIGAAAISAFKKIRGVGPRAVRVGNACIFALADMGAEGVAQLAMLKAKVKVRTAQRLIDKELGAAAARLGVPREEVEEMSVPGYGLEKDGVRRERLGDFTAELVVRGPGDSGLRWLRPDGKPQKSVPTAIRKEYADEFKELKAAQKDIDRMLSAQRDRIDGLFLQQKSWPLAAWRERYFDHPLVGTIARRLIWECQIGGETASGSYLEDQMVGRDDRPLGNVGGSITVSLWHPIGRPVDEVLGWRAWLERHEIRQPFKQAHREVYVLTDAERTTGVYSNRFAAHIIRQAQFRQLANLRGWKTGLLGGWDGGGDGVAHRKLARHGLRAEFWTEGVEGEYQTGYAYLSTDQVRFYREDEPEPMPLEDVPPLVFSEVMRDVDLFVGVASVGNDPNWSDGGPQGQYLDYWQSYSFGDLSATAQTRKEILQRLVPRLKIAERCAFSDRFLVVRGDLRTYKIHLGSGNVLMSPNDQYLCIVPKQSAAAKEGGRIYLPFEGDNVLSIVLSKALLLADDTKIKDATIVRQIGKR